MSRLIVFGIALVLVFLPVSNVEQDKGPNQAISAVLADQVAAWNKGDLNAFMVGYHRTDEITFFSAGNTLKGWESVLKRYQKQYQAEGKEMGKLVFRDLSIELLGTDAAFVRGRWELTRSTDKPGGLFTLIFRKTADGWRIVHDHTSQGD